MLPQGDFKDLLQSLLSEMGGYLLSIALTTCLAGILVMVLIEAIKEFLPVRRWFQRWWLLEWLRQQADYARTDRDWNLPGQTSESIVARAEDQFIRAATAGNRSAFYQLQLERLCGQLNAVAQMALDQSKEFREFLALFGWRNAKDAVVTIRRREGESPSIDSETLGQLVQALQRSIDSIQIAAGADWQDLMRWAAFVFSYGILTIGIAYAILPKDDLLSIFLVLAAALLFTVWLVVIVFYFAMLGPRRNSPSFSEQSSSGFVAWGQRHPTIVFVLSLSLSIMLAALCGDTKIAAFAFFRGEPFISWFLLLCLTTALPVLLILRRRRKPNFLATWVPLVLIETVWCLVIVISYFIGRAIGHNYADWGLIFGNGYVDWWPTSGLLVASWISAFIASVSRDIVVGLRRVRG